MNLTDLQAKHDKAVADLNYINASQANALLATNTAAEELGKAKLGAAISLIRKVYTEAPVGSAASVDIVKTVTDIYTVEACRKGEHLADAYGLWLYGAVRGDQAGVISARVPASKSAFAAPYGSNIPKDQDSVTKQTIDNMQTQTITHGVSTRPVGRAVPLAELGKTRDDQIGANAAACRQAKPYWDWRIHPEFGTIRGEDFAVPQVDTLDKWAVRHHIRDDTYIALVHIQTGHVTTGFPNMREVCRYIKGRDRTGFASSGKGMRDEYESWMYPND